MARATIELEFMPGDDIESSFSEAIRIAKLLRCNANFDFNGVLCVARPGGNAKDGALKYHEALKNKDDRSKMAFA